MPFAIYVFPSVYEGVPHVFPSSDGDHVLPLEAHLKAEDCKTCAH